jgi:RNA polymerase sigma-70 factor (ECF subfamily)
VKGTLAGDWTAFSELVGRYRDAACAVAYHYLGSFEEAQDAAQEAFVRAYVHLRELREPAKFGPWLRRITATVCVGLLRKQGDRPVSLETQAPRAAASPDEDLERAATRMVVREALSRLSRAARLTVTLYYINGYSHGEIAGFLDCPITTVRTRLHRAKKKLREEMMTMVSEVLHEGRPDESFTEEVERRLFSYTATNEGTGIVITGTSEAGSEKELVRRLTAKGYRVTKVVRGPELPEHRTRKEREAEQREAASRVVTVVLDQALKDRARSIRVQSQPRGSMTVSYLIGDQWHEVMSMPKYVWAPLRQRLAEMGRVKLRYGAAPEPTSMTHASAGTRTRFTARFRRGLIEIALGGG